MSFGTYSELAEAVARWVDRTDRGTEIQEWVRLVELEVSRKVPLRSQQLVESGTLTSGSSAITSQPGILMPKQIVFDTSPPVVVDISTISSGVEAAFAEAGRATPSKASVWGIDPGTGGTQIRVWPTPPADISYRIFYEGGMTPLTPSNPTNYLLLAAPDLYLHGCLYYSGLFDEDDAAASRWRAILTDTIALLKRIEWKARVQGGRLAVRPRGATP